MKFEFDNSLGVVELGLLKDDIRTRAKEFVKKDKKLKVFESEHNILIKHKEINRELRTNHVIMFTFDDSEKLVAVRLNDIAKLDFKGVRVPGKKLVLGHKNIIKVIESGENFERYSRCPILNKTIDLSVKECDVDYYKNCQECEHRSNQRIDSDFKNFNCMMTYDVDFQKNLSIIDLDLRYEAYDKYWFTSRFGDTELQ